MPVADDAAAYAAGAPWTVDDIALRLALLMVLMIPMAVTDIRTRTVDTALMYAMCGVGAVMFAHDFLAGRYHAAGPLVLAGASVSLAIGGLMIAAARVAGIMGDADGAAVLAAAAAVPAVGDLPVVPAAVAVSCVVGAVLMIGRQVWYNISDVLHGRSPPDNFLYRHNKRRGERFTIRDATLDASGTDEKIGAADDDGTVRNAAGGEYFAPAEDHGMPVSSTAPMYALLCAGLLSACTALLLTDFGASHVERLFTGGLGAFIADPGVTLGPRDMPG